MYHVPDQSGRRIIVTGANSGTGKETAKRLAGAGAAVVLAVRSIDKGEAARSEILQSSPASQLEVRQLDLADLSNVRAFAATMLAEDRPIHTLVNNAGVMTPPQRIESSDGFELQFATNFLGPFLLTNLLLPRLLASGDARVATMSSGAAITGSIHFADLQWRQHYSPWAAYGQSKLADLLMGLYLARLAEYKNWPLLSTMAHPGYTHTNLQKSGPNLGNRRPLLNVAPLMNLIPGQEATQGAEPLLFAAADPGAIQGGYYGPRNLLTGPTRPARVPASARRGPDLAASLWVMARQLTGAPSLSGLRA
ncbi:MAG: SDR family oxidoreductase [Propionibacteriaceae bacterium]|jgi:NAD(P)-dependent dehydrogenase (short-subunit alcohol dehydrogenase family)|nr:SDR family oxidoreductase [Propionibacteriaceae bacterium]